MNAFDEFKIQIKTINVKDFGDFRRKSNTYLNRLLEKTPQAQGHPIARQLKTLVNFEPDWQMESTRRRILKKVDLLREDLKL